MGERRRWESGERYVRGIEEVAWEGKEGGMEDFKVVEDERWYGGEEF